MEQLFSGTERSLNFTLSIFKAMKGLLQDMGNPATFFLCHTKQTIGTKVYSNSRIQNST
jgi:hypothetical protein